MYHSAQRRRRRGKPRRPRSTKDSPHGLRVVALVVAAALAVVGLRYTNLRLLDQRLVDIRRLPDSLLSAGFALSSAREIQIDVAGAGYARQVPGEGGSIGTKLENVWVIDASTREHVWDVRQAPKERGPDGVVVYKEAVALPEGQYVLYCAVRTEEQYRQDGSWLDWLDRDGELLESRLQRDNDSDDFHITVTGKGRRLTDSEVVAALDAFNESATLAEDRQPTQIQRVRPRNTDAVGRPRREILVDLTRLENDEAKFAHFSLSRRTDVRAYAIGEGMNGEMYDYGWIVNTANGRTVWEMRYRVTEHAGGNRKNRVVDATISLRRGNYVAYFVTDDSHSYEDWNARPPTDEEGWGITVVEVSRSGNRDTGRRGGGDH